MRNLLLLMITGLMSTVGVYAAGLGGTPTIKTVGSPTTVAISVDWTFVGDQVSGGIVSWTPTATGVHTVTLGAGGESGSFTTASLTGGSPTNTTLTFGSPVEASAVATAKVIIRQD